jgi:hypothetical protein
MVQMQSPKQMKPVDPPAVQSVEENLIYITWLSVIYNSYWTHLAWATQPDTAQAELDKATADALKQLEQLVNRHARSVKGRPAPSSGEEQPAPHAEPACEPQVGLDVAGSQTG